AMTFLDQVVGLALSQLSMDLHPELAHGPLLFLCGRLIVPSFRGLESLEVWQFLPPSVSARVPSGLLFLRRGHGIHLAILTIPVHHDTNVPALAVRNIGPKQVTGGDDLVDSGSVLDVEDHQVRLPGVRVNSKTSTHRLLVKGQTLGRTGHDDP